MDVSVGFGMPLQVVPGWRLGWCGSDVAAEGMTSQKACVCSAGPGPPYPLRGGMRAGARRGMLAAGRVRGISPALAYDAKAGQRACFLVPVAGFAG
jgi:hypothetical protein